MQKKPKRKLTADEKLIKSYKNKVDIYLVVQCKCNNQHIVLTNWRNKQIVCTKCKNKLLYFGTVNYKYAKLIYQRNTEV